MKAIHFIVVHHQCWIAQILCVYIHFEIINFPVIKFDFKNTSTRGEMPPQKTMIILYFIHFIRLHPFSKINNLCMSFFPNANGFITNCSSKPRLFVINKQSIDFSENVLYIKYGLERTGENKNKKDYNCT